MLSLCYYTSLNRLLIVIHSLSKQLKGHSGPTLVTFWEMEKVMKMKKNYDNIKELQPVGIYMEYMDKVIKMAQSNNNVKVLHKIMIM